MRSEQIRNCMSKGFLLSPTVLEGNIELEDNLLERLDEHGLLVIHKDLIEFFSDEDVDNFNWNEMEKARALFEKKKNIHLYTNFLSYLNNPIQDLGIRSASPGRIKIFKKYKEFTKKREVQDFVDFFNIRYRSIESVLRNRRELQDVTSINKVKRANRNQGVSVIGMVYDKRKTKNNHIMLSLEDPTGIIKVLVNKKNRKLYEIADDIVMDEVIGITGTTGRDIIFSDKILFPDIHSFKQLKRAPEESYALFLSDLHIGSKHFLEKEFEKFIGWIKGEEGNEKHKQLAKKIDYIFILGDLVDGVGVYPGQEEDLVIDDIYNQYEVCANYLKQIPSNIKIIAIPGNHDAVRLAEPQNPIYKDLAEPLYNIPNLEILYNPCFVNILSTDDFPGFNLLLYHGYSLTHYADEVNSIRRSGGVDRPDLIMKFLLQKRHLAPSHCSNLYIPHPEIDQFVIKAIPDFFVTGHLHKSSASNYKNITMISGSCWQAKTDFMEKMGIHPEPARVPIVNLKTRAVKILRFDR